MNCFYLSANVRRMFWKSKILQTKCLVRCESCSGLPNLRLVYPAKRFFDAPYPFEMQPKRFRRISKPSGVLPKRFTGDFFRKALSISHFLFVF